MGEGKDLKIGILDILAVVQDKAADMGGKLDSPGELPEEEGDRSQEERQD